MPLAVIWLCPSCHRTAHAALRLRTDRKAELRMRSQAAKKAARTRELMLTWRVNPEEISESERLTPARFLAITKERQQRDQGREQKAG